MKIEIDDKVVDRIVQKQCKEWVDYYEREIELAKRAIEGKEFNRIPVKFNDPKKDLKYLKKQLKAWKRALDDYSFMYYFQK